MEFLTEIISGTASGFLTGGLGTVLTTGLSIWKQSSERKDKLLEMQHEYKLIEMNRQTQQMETEQELLIAEHQAGVEALTNAYEHDDVQNVSPWVSNIIKLFRPSITLGLLILVAIMWFTTDDEAIKVQIATMVLFSASAALSFWFGDRTVSKYVEKAGNTPWL